MMSKHLKISRRKVDKCHEISIELFKFLIDPPKLIFENKKLCFLFRAIYTESVFESFSNSIQYCDLSINFYTSLKIRGNAHTYCYCTVVGKNNEADIEYSKIDAP